MAVRFAPQQAGAQRVERRDPGAGHASVPEQRLDARTHFFRGLVGEGDGKNFIGLREALGDQIRDALRDDARLARTGAGKDQQRAVDVQDRVALFGIQGCEWIHVGDQASGLWARGQSTSGAQA